jgi:hypothetical protein
VNLESGGFLQEPGSTLPFDWNMTEAPEPNRTQQPQEVLVQPLSRSLALAPVDEEHITPETAAALDRARASLAGGEGVPHEEILRELGLSAPDEELHPYFAT